MSPSELLAITQPVHARAEISRRRPSTASCAPSRLPEAVVSGAMRRIASPQGLLGRGATGPGAAPRGPIDLLPAIDRDCGGAAGRRADRHGRDDVVASPPGRAVARAAGACRRNPSRRGCWCGSIPTAPCSSARSCAWRRPTGTWTRPDPLAPVATGLEFPDPMYDGLREVAPELLLPGLQNVEADSVALLETSPRVIEAYMVGLNHEMNRELLWREFPADLTGTPFRQFWDVRGQRGDPETLKDIPPLVDMGRRPRSARTCADRARAVNSCCSCAAS